MDSALTEADLARLDAVEHAFDTLAYFTVVVAARQGGVTAEVALERFRNGVVGSVFDAAGSAERRRLIRAHLQTRFDNVAAMIANLGPQG